MVFPRAWRYNLEMNEKYASVSHAPILAAPKSSYDLNSEYRGKNKAMESI